MTRFCPKCGKRGIKGDFCSECVEKDTKLQFKDIVIKKCLSCDRFMIQHKWQSFKTIDEGIISAVYAKIKNPKNVLLDIEPKYGPLKDKPGASQDIELMITAEDEEFTIPAKIDFTVCPNCSKEGTQYFEGMLQLRNTTPELVDYVLKDIQAHKSEGVHITKEEERKGFADIQLTSAKYMRALGKRLVQRFNGELTETCRLFSRDRSTGKDIYRISVLFKMRPHKIGDIVQQKGKDIKITNLGKHITGIDIKTGKKTFLN
jgi:nonsense-mediated mRNA decay protein 3